MASQAQQGLLDQEFEDELDGLWDEIYQVDAVANPTEEEQFNEWFNSNMPDSQGG